jgi:uncharacterized protein
MFSPSRRTWLGLAALGLLLAPVPARAALTAEVRDDAKLFKAEAVKEADTIIRAIKRDHNLDLLIETYPDIPADKKAAYDKVKGDEEKRKEFFVEWGLERFKTAEVNGIYILITKEPGHVQIEVGDETGRKAFTKKDRDHLRDLMLGHFKKKEFDKGLLEGVEYVRKTVDDNLKGQKKGAQPAVPAPGRHQEPTVVERPSLPPWVGWVCVGLAVVAGIWVVFAIIRGLSGAGGGAYGPGGGYGGGFGGGGGFLTGMLGGLFGAAAGSWLYDRYFRGDSGYGGAAQAGEGAPAAAQPEDTDATGTGGDFGGDGGDAGGGGGDFGGDTGDGGGGDFGGDAGGDFGGGDFGGGDFGGGDTGGGGDF